MLTVICFCMADVSTVGGVMVQIARKLQEVSADEGDKYLDYINTGMQDLANYFPDAPWLQASAVLTLANGSDRWQLSSINSSIRQVYDVGISAQNVKLSFLDPETFDDLTQQSGDTGVPTVFTVYNSEIRFHPIPDNNYGAQVKFGKNVTTVSAASATFDFPKLFVEGVTLYCWAQGLYDREDYEYAPLVEQKYQAWIAKVKKELRKVVLGKKRMIGVREIQATNRVYNNEVSQMFFG